MDDVMQALKPVGEKYTAGDLTGGLQLLHDLWNQLPTPKPATPNAYMIVEYGVAFAFKLNDMNEAWFWANQAPEFKDKRLDSGEVEFLIGKVAYEDGKIELAKEQFLEAKRKSRGRAFIDAPPKYAALLKNK
jgi:hypothetical protein